jgi:hypothetical protein
MFKNLWDKIKTINYAAYITGGIIGSLFVIAITALSDNPPLTEYKGGIQNRLVWNIKGECFFVRPAVNTVYLVRVEDCDKGTK